MRRPSAFCLIRDLPHYRRHAFVRGLEANGFTVRNFVPSVITTDDVLVVWNRYGATDQMAKSFEKAGARVLVAENGYVGKDHLGRQLYAIARNHHNGAGAWTCGEADRWKTLGIELKPWRQSGRHLLVLPQRGIGPSGVAMPKSWPSDIVARLKRLTDRPVRLRPHPGKERPSLGPDLEDCWAAVTWGSGAGIKVIIAGIPVFHEMALWIGAPAARGCRLADGRHDGATKIEEPFLGDRLPMLQRLAWAQFTVEEIQSGEAFQWALK